jgi:hypothetical protein
MAEATKSALDRPPDGRCSISFWGRVAGSESVMKGGDELLLLEAELEDVYSVLRNLQLAVYALLYPEQGDRIRVPATQIPRVVEVVELMKTELGVQLELSADISCVDLAALLGRVGNSIKNIAEQSQGVAEE